MEDLLQAAQELFHIILFREPRAGQIIIKPLFI